MLPLQVGSINDYGQTLEAEDRAQLLSLIENLKAEGINFVYLASWRDPFGNPQRYAMEVFRAWNLSEKSLLVVFLRGEDRRWQVVLHFGAAVSPPSELETLRAQAELEANRARPGYAVVRFTSNLLAALHEAKARVDKAKKVPWKLILFGLAFLGVLFLLLRWFCPRCGRILRRVHSVSGIIWVCPRCRYTRAGWGRRLGGRRGFYP